MTNHNKYFKATKKHMRYTLYVALFIFVASLSFLVSSIFQNIPSPHQKHIDHISQIHENENTFIPNDIADDIHQLTPNTHTTKNKIQDGHNTLGHTILSKIFDANNLNHNLIPQFTSNLPSQLTQTQQNLSQIQHTHNTSQYFDIFTFSSENIANPMDALASLIQELYTLDTSLNIQNTKAPDHTNTDFFDLLHIAQDVNTALMKTLHTCVLNQKETLFLESAVRIDNDLKPYPFIVLELRHHDTFSRPYFTDKKIRDNFIQTLKNNLTLVRSHTQFSNTKNQRIQIIDEGGFLYITFENIISHIIRLEKRKERLQKIDPLKKENMYCTLIIDDFGENYPLARQFMDLPFPVIFSIWPQSTHSTKIATIAHEKGLPIFLHQPMQAMALQNHRAPDMGKSGITIDMTQEEIKAILQYNLLSVPHARGLNNHMGSLFTSTPYAVETFLRAIKSIMPQIFILDSVTHANSHLYERARAHIFLSAKRHYFIDNNEQNISKELQNVYEHAKKNTHVYAIGHARVNTLKALQNWQAVQDKNLIFTLPSSLNKP